MQSKLSSILASGSFTKDPDCIYSASMPPSNQEHERILREQVAAYQSDDYLNTISQHHSIEVMDHEIERFLAGLPQDAIILDIGGCWGWHWRNLASIRPDVGVLIIDFVRGNLVHAQRMLSSLVGTQVALMHADATSLPFPDAKNFYGFDGIWTVQVFQHIPDFALACKEAYRVLKNGGSFVNYSLHATPINRMVFFMLGKKFHIQGTAKNNFHLTRANNSQLQIVKDIFGEVKNRYTELFFHPDLRLTIGGRAGSLLGRFDARMSEMSCVGYYFARQRSFEAKK
jgi:ubiquinone/menaquinone biosynthesis C-methylase UbiE